MRNTLRLALVAAVAAVSLPTSSANAAGCTPPLGPVCEAICIVFHALDRPCPR